VAGIQSTGAQVIDIGYGLMPVNRFAVRYHQADGGVHIRTDKRNRNMVHIEFADESGTNIQRAREREIENLFCRDDFKRSSGERIKRVVTIGAFPSLYISSGLKSLPNSALIKRSNINIYVSSFSESVLNLAAEYLEGLGCQPRCFYASSRKESLDQHLDKLSRTVVKEKTDLGIHISENGEELVLIDSNGGIVGREAYTALAAILSFKKGMKRIVLPYIAPSIIDRVAEAYGARVDRTKSNPSNIMNAMLRTEGAGENNMLQYYLTYDAIWAIGYLLEFIVEEKTSLKALIEEIPSFYYVKKEIPCKWEDKARVMREMIISQNSEAIELFEGIKIKADGGWALILPDCDRAAVNIYAEGLTKEYAEELSVHFSDKVKSLLK
jgi:mannose-1-phosphate guanylyltransferase/phosphomannomutase